MSYGLISRQQDFSSKPPHVHRLTDKYQIWKSPTDWTIKVFRIQRTERLGQSGQSTGWWPARTMLEEFGVWRLQPLTPQRRLQQHHLVFQPKYFRLRYFQARHTFLSTLRQCIGFLYFVGWFVLYFLSDGHFHWDWLKWSKQMEWNRERWKQSLSVLASSPWTDFDTLVSFGGRLYWIDYFAFTLTWLGLGHFPYFMHSLLPCRTRFNDYGWWKFTSFSIWFIIYIIMEYLFSYWFIGSMVC